MEGKTHEDQTKIWRLIECGPRTKDKIPKQFSIENIPKNRWDEVLDHLCDYYIPEEPICQSLRLKDDRVAIDDLRREWRGVLEQGVSVGIFLHDTKLSKRPLIGVNVLYIGTKKSDAVGFQKTAFNSEIAGKMVEMFWRVHHEADIFVKCETEIYIGAIGLSIHPHYRGYGLAKYILNTRTQIGRELGISVTVTNFTGPLSQLAAKRAGFETLREQRYDEMLDESGKIIFPVERSKKIKVMGKKLY